MRIYIVFESRYYEENIILVTFSKEKAQRLVDESRDEDDEPRCRIEEHEVE